MAPAQADALLAQDLPDVVDADAQLLRDQGAGPVRVACGRGFVQAGEDAPHGRLGVAGRLAGTRLVGKTEIQRGPLVRSHAVLGRARKPLPANATAFPIRHTRSRY